MSKYDSANATICEYVEVMSGCSIASVIKHSAYSYRVS